jgi:protein tyrosine/serine phosphatase
MTRIAVCLLVLGSVAVSAIGCRSSQPFDCATSPPRPPRNLGVVAGTAGSPIAIYRGGQPESCGEMEHLKAIGVKSILKLNDAGRPIDVAEKQQAAALGLTMTSFGFEASSIGEASTCTDVAEALAFLRDESNWPVYVHCTMGKDRTGYVVGMFERLYLGRDTAEVLDHLRQFGHNGARAVTFGQIDRELAKELPTCAPLPAR